MCTLNKNVTGKKPNETLDFHSKDIRFSFKNLLSFYNYVAITVLGLSREQKGLPQRSAILVVLFSPLALRYEPAYHSRALSPDSKEICNFACPGSMVSKKALGKLREK